MDGTSTWAKRIKIEAVDTDRIATNKTKKGEVLSLSDKEIEEEFDKVNQDR
jgi:hypothetical protein